MTEPRPPVTPTESHATVPAKPVKSAPKGTEEAGYASFPASDPPAVWTWEVKKD
jgi:hypothetical protein